MTRRKILKRMAAIGAAVCAAPYYSLTAHAANPISLVGWGGRSEEFAREHWIKPFTAETGIPVIYVSGPDLAKVKAQVATNNVEWDVINTSGSQAYSGAKQGLWETIDTKIVSPDKFTTKPPPFATPLSLFSGGFAYNPNRTKPLKEFAQLWDIKNFPGRRAFKTRPDMTLEIALLADGVPANKLYPLDVERAFQGLDRIKRHVNKWWDATTESITLLQRNETDYSFTLSGRAKAAAEAGVPVDFCFDQCLCQKEYLTVLKGTKNKESAMRFVDFITRPENAGPLANFFGVIPTVMGGEKSINAKTRRWLPDLKNPKIAIVNDEYWADNYAEMDKRYKEWLRT